jgi:hypothetical protein
MDWFVPKADSVPQQSEGNTLLDFGTEADVMMADYNDLYFARQLPAQPSYR